MGQREKEEEEEASQNLFLMWPCSSSTTSGLFCCFGAPHAVFPSFVGRTQLLRIMDCMDQNDSTHYALVDDSGKAGMNQKDSDARLVLLVFLALCSILSSSGHRCLSSWPVWTRRSGTCGDVRKTAENPQLQFITVVDFPVVTPRLIPMVLLTIERYPSCYLTRWSMSSLCRPCRFSLS